MKKKSQTNKQNNHKKNKKNNKKKNNNQKKHNSIKSKRKQTGGGIFNEQEQKEWDAGMKDLKDMSRQDLDELKQDYQQRDKSLGGAFSNFKFSFAGENSFRPAPRPPECSIL